MIVPAAESVALRSLLTAPAMSRVTFPASIRQAVANSNAEAVGSNMATTAATSGAATAAAGGRPVTVNLNQTIQALDSSGVANLLQRGPVKAGVVRAVQSALANGATLTQGGTRK